MLFKQNTINLHLLLEFAISILITFKIKNITFEEKYNINL